MWSVEQTEPIVSSALLPPICVLPKTLTTLSNGQITWRITSIQEDRTGRGVKGGPPLPVLGSMKPSSVLEEHNASQTRGYLFAVSRQSMIFYQFALTTSLITTKLETPLREVDSKGRGFETAVTCIAFLCKLSDRCRRCHRWRTVCPSLSLSRSRGRVGFG